MITNEVVEYIKKQVNQGVSNKDIIKSLQDSGWVINDISEAFTKAGMLNTDTVTVATSDPPLQASPTVQQQEVLPELNNKEEVVSALPQKSNNNKIIGIVMGVVLLFVLFGVAIGAYKYYKITPSDPIEILLSSIEAQKEINSARVVGVTDVSAVFREKNTTEEVDTEIDFSLNYDVEYSGSDLKNFAFSGDIEKEVDFSSDFIDVNIGGNLDIRIIDSVIYLQLRDTKPFLFFSSYEDQWIAIDMTDIASELEMFEIDEIINTSQLNEDSKAVIIQLITEHFGNEEVINTLRSGITLVGAEDVNDVKAHHIEIQFSKEEWTYLFNQYVAFVNGVQKNKDIEDMLVDGDEVIEELMYVTEEMMDTPMLDDIMAIFAQIKMNIWIDKETNHAVKYAVSLDAENETLTDDGESINFDIRAVYGVNVYNINQPIEVEKPKDSIDSKSWIEVVLGSGTTDISEVSYISEDMIKVVDASDIGPYLQGLEFTDKKGNIITIYVAETLSKDSVKIKEGIDLGAIPDYELITNNFIEVIYPDSVKDYIKIIKVIPNGNFNTVMRLDDDADVMAMVPFSDVDDQGKEFEFRITPINGKIIFSLINITE